MLEDLRVKVHRPVVLNQVDGLHSGIGGSNLPIEADKLAGQKRIGLPVAYPTGPRVETGGDPVLLAPGMPDGRPWLLASALAYN